MSCLPLYLLTRRHDGKTPGSGDSQSVHRFTDDILPEHRPQCCLTIAAPGVGSPPRALELNVYPLPRRQNMLAQQDSAAITQHREVAELVARVGLRDGLGAGGKDLPREETCPIAFE